jgi:hypothetical protein
MTDYRALRTAGHDPIKAGEIVLDAGRGERAALEAIKAARMSAGA